MRAYFQMVGSMGIINNITISLQRMKGGTANRAENWAGVKMQEFLDFQTEWTTRGDVALEGMTWALCRTGRVAAPARLAPGWNDYGPGGYGSTSVCEPTPL